MTEDIGTKTPKAYIGTRFIYYIMILNVIMGFVYCLGMIFDINIFISIANMFIMLSTCFCFIIYFSNQIFRGLTLELFLILGLIISITIAFFLHSGNISYKNYIIKIMNFMALPSLFVIVKNIKVDRKMISIILKVNFIMSLVYIYASTRSNAYYVYNQYHPNGTPGDSLTLSLSNPNLTAIYLMITCMLLCVGFAFTNRKALKAISLIDACIIFYLITLTRSRTCSIICVFLIIITILKRKPKIKKWVFPLMFGYFLVSSIVLPWFTSLPFMQDVVIFGKELGTRDVMFQIITPIIKANIIFGYFGAFALGNAHNTILSVMVSGGIFSLIFYVFMYYTYYHNCEKNIGNMVNYIAFICLIGILIHGTTEAVLMLSGTYYSALVSVFIIACSYKEIENENSNGIKLSYTPSNSIV